MDKELREIPDEEDDNPFVCLAQLLYRGVSVATLATAIERHGIYTWDRFGRFGIAKRRDRERAFDALAREHDWMELDPHEQSRTQSPADEWADEPSSPYANFGWAV